MIFIVEVKWIEVERFFSGGVAADQVREIFQVSFEINFRDSEFRKNKLILPSPPMTKK